MSRLSILLAVFVALFVVAANGQEPTREQKIQELQTLKTKAEQIENQLEEIESRQSQIEEEILAPSESDATEAEKENASVFRIFPRNLLEGKISVRGGAAYFSFTNRSHSYDDVPQIELQNGNFLVGFAGADYGFISDLGVAASLSAINGKTKGVKLLAEYQPPTAENDARREYQKSNAGFEIEKTKYGRQVPAVVGHAYALRAISYDEADVLVVFKVHRSDSDGSLVIFYKIIEIFATPKLQRNNTFAISPQKSDTEVETPDILTQIAVQNLLYESGFLNVTVEATNQAVTVRGTVPKGKIAEVVQKAQETGKRPVINQVTEQ